MASVSPGNHRRISTRGLAPSAPGPGRVFATGGLRFRINSWFDVQQIGGGFETGLQDRVPVDIAYHIRVGDGPWRGHEIEETMLELKALGTGYIVVHGPKSREYYRDLFRTERISSTLKPVFHIEDDTVYSLPVRSLAHVLRSDELPSADPVVHPDTLQRYVAAIEDLSRPLLNLEWHDPNHFTVTGAVPEGNLVELQVSANRGWRATQEGRPVRVDQDRLGFIVLHPAPSPATRLELEYRGTREQRIMAMVSIVSWIAAFGGWFWVRRQKHAGCRISELRPTTGLS